MNFKEYTLNKETIIAGHKRIMDLCWRVFEGYSSTELLRQAIMKLGQDTNQFAIIRFDGMYYGVSVENAPKQVVIAKDYVWYRTYGHNLQRFRMKQDTAIPYKIENARMSRRWTETMIEVMNSFVDDFDCILPERKFGYSNTYFKIACQVLFGCAMYNTLLTLDQLHAVDDFFVNCPSEWIQYYKKRDIEKMNPFTCYTVYKSGRRSWNL